MAANASAVLDALGDPTRRRIVECLRSGPLPVGRIAALVPVSRPAVSQHLRVLRDAGLVTSTASGTRHLYAVDPDGIAAARAWLDRFWGEALDAFARAVDADGPPDQPSDPPSVRSRRSNR